MKVFKVICVLFVFGFVSVSHAAVIFITEKDAGDNVTSLLGADNVEVNNKFYNVRFVDGTCIMLFNGCDASDDFLFNTKDSAEAASDSLLLQVFNDDSLVDLGPSQTNGCFELYGCSIFTVGYGLHQELGWVSGVLLYDIDVWGLGFRRTGVPLQIDRDTDIDRGLVYAVWSEPVEASAPGTAMIMLMGIAGLIVSQRRKQA
jgi:hypothetical protein